MKGTQQTMKSRSPTAKLRINRLVVFRICLLKVTTKITKLLPKKPIKTTMLKKMGTTMETTSSSLWKSSLILILGSTVVVSVRFESIVSVTRCLFQIFTRTVISRRTSVTRCYTELSEDSKLILQSYQMISKLFNRVTRFLMLKKYIFTVTRYCRYIFTELPNVVK